jgi:hypothetical protein
MLKGLAPVDGCAWVCIGVGWWHGRPYKSPYSAQGVIGAAGSQETARVPPSLDSPQSAAPETFLSRDAASAFPFTARDPAAPVTFNHGAGNPAACRKCISQRSPHFVVRVALTRRPCSRQSRHRGGFRSCVSRSAGKASIRQFKWTRSVAGYDDFFLREVNARSTKTRSGPVDSSVSRSQIAQPAP